MFGERYTMPKFIKTSLKIIIGCILIVVFVTGFGCAHKGDWGERIGWKEIDFERLPGQEKYPNAGAIVLLDEGKMEIIGSNDKRLSVFEQRRVVRILNARGRRFLNIAIPYNPDTEVQFIKARTISPDGRITVLKDEDIYDVTFYPEYVFYSDQQAKLFTLPAVEDGSVIEYRYRLNFGMFTHWHYWHFQEEVPTLISRFTLIEPSEWDIHYRLYGIDLQPYVDENPPRFKNTYTWEARDVPPIKQEFGMPSMRERAARLVLSPIGVETWDDVAEWYFELSEPQIKAGSGVKALASRLIEGVIDDREKLRRIYEWVRDNIRYIAVAIGIGGFEPHPAEEILYNRYGDCKDMSTLICSLAREAGINARLALVSTWPNGIPDTTLPSPLHFNHAIVYCPDVNESNIWMDATAKGCPFGTLPWFDQGLPVVVVNQNRKAQATPTPCSSPDHNHTRIEWRVTIDSTALASVEGMTIIRGAPAMELREELFVMSEDEQKQWLETWLAGRCSGIVLDSFEFDGIEPVQDTLSISYFFQTSHFMIHRSGEMILRPEAVMPFDLPDYFRSESRVHPIRFLYGIQNDMELIVELPDDWSLEGDFVADSVHSRFGRATWICSENDGIFRAGMTIYLQGKEISPEDHREFRIFLDTVQKKNLRDVVFHNK